MAQSVDIVIRARDEASAKFGYIGNSLTKMVMRFGGAYMAVRVIGGLTDAITEVHKSYRKAEGAEEDFIFAILNHIPIIKIVSKSIQELAKEISGLNEATEKTEKSNKVLDDMIKLNQQLSDSIEKARFSAKQRPEIEAWLKYRDTIKEIQKLQLEARKAGVGIDFGLWEKANQDYLNTLEEIRRKPVTDIINQLQKQIDTFGMSASEIAVYEASLTKANEAELRHIKILKKRLDWLEMNRRILNEDKEAVERLADQLTFFAEEVKEAIKTPEEKIADIATAVQVTIRDGLITAAQGMKYIEQETERILGKKRKEEHGFLAAEEARFLTFAPGTRFNQTEKNTGETVKYTSRMAKLLETTNKKLDEVKTAVGKTGVILTVSNFP